MTCEECGAVADEAAEGCRPYRTDLAESAEDDVVPPMAFFCTECAVREGTSMKRRGLP
jgi:hypothetical protein